MAGAGKMLAPCHKVRLNRISIKRNIFFFSKNHQRQLFCELKRKKIFFLSPIFTRTCAECEKAAQLKRW
jgi:hypothetical protein